MIPTTTIENPSNTLTALIRATKIVTKSAAPRRANLDRVRTVSLQRCRAGVGWSRASTISSSQRKLIIVTRPLQVNPRSPRHPPVIRTGIAKTIQAAMEMRRMRRRTTGAGSSGGKASRFVSDTVNKRQQHQPLHLAKAQTRVSVPHWLAPVAAAGRYGRMYVAQTLLSVLVRLATAGKQVAITLSAGRCGKG